MQDQESIEEIQKDSNSTGLLPPEHKEVRSRRNIYLISLNAALGGFTWYYMYGMLTDGT